MRISNSSRTPAGVLLLGALLWGIAVVLHTPAPAEATGLFVIAHVDMNTNTCGVGGDVEGVGAMTFRQAESGAMHVSCVGSYAGPDLSYAVVAETDCAGVGGRVTLTPSKRFSFTCTYPPDPISPE